MAPRKATIFDDVHMQCATCKASRGGASDTHFGASAAGCYGHTERGARGEKQRQCLAEHALLRIARICRVAPIVNNARKKGSPGWHVLRGGECRVTHAWKRPCRRDMGARGMTQRENGPRQVATCAGEQAVVWRGKGALLFGATQLRCDARQ